MKKLLPLLTITVLVIVIAAAYMYIQQRSETYEININGYIVKLDNRWEFNHEIVNENLEELSFIDKEKSYELFMTATNKRNGLDQGILEGDYSINLIEGQSPINVLVIVENEKVIYKLLEYDDCAEYANKEYDPFISQPTYARVCTPGGYNNFVYTRKTLGYEYVTFVIKFKTSDYENESEKEKAEHTVIELINNILNAKEAE